MPLSLPALMTLVAVLWYLVTAYQVGRVRGKYKIAAPAVSGAPEFERAYRVQMNELEQLVAFLPSMWIFAWFGNPRWAAIACGVFIAGRVIYAIGYWADARRRAIGFYIGAFALGAVWIGAFWSVIRWLSFA